MNDETMHGWTMHSDRNGVVLVHLPSVLHQEAGNEPRMRAPKDAMVPIERQGGQGTA